jgi:hypothetical protein
MEEVDIILLLEERLMKIIKIKLVMGPNSMNLMMHLSIK